MAVIDGSTWDDYLDGTPGSDSIFADQRNNTVYAYEGDDYVDGWLGDDYINGGSGNDTLLGYDGNDTIDGWMGNDYIYGEAGNDKLLGYDGNDFLFGGTGSDTLKGEWGNDLLNGGANGYDSLQYDNLTGGAGADTFVLGDVFGVYYQGFGYATITDFNWAEGDKIQVFGSINDYSVNTNGSGGVNILYQGDFLAQVNNTTNVIPSLDFTSIG
jgi:Ca2+-binding RTX toxin-like protein